MKRNKVKVDVKISDTTITIEGFYSAGDKEVRYYPDMSGYPGSPSSFEITGVKCSTDLTDLINYVESTKDVWKDLEEKAIEAYEDN